MLYNSHYNHFRFCMRADLGLVICTSAKGKSGLLGELNTFKKFMYSSVATHVHRCSTVQSSDSNWNILPFFARRGNA